MILRKNAPSVESVSENRFSFLKKFKKYFRNHHIQTKLELTVSHSPDIFPKIWITHCAKSFPPDPSDLPKLNKDKPDSADLNLIPAACFRRKLLE
jgi:hypothetical protein